jgi:glc operon protein GlcG
MKRSMRMCTPQAVMLIVLVGSVFANSTLFANETGSHRLGLNDARHVIRAAQRYAAAHEAPGASIAIVDAGGMLVALERLDSTFPAASEVSVGKARTAALFQKPTRVFEDLVNKGRVTMVGLSAIVGFTPLKGGVPLVADGQVVGAIGVSGAASAEQDDEIAEAASTALGDADKDDVTYIEGDRVRDAFAKSATLLEHDSLKVNASRRDTPGEAEVHLRDTDVFYILDGDATLVTGGEVQNAHQTSADEIRGSGIARGTERRLQRGDVVAIGAGTPHWFKSVDSPVTYYVVKSDNQGS